MNFRDAADEGYQLYGAHETQAVQWNDNNLTYNNKEV